MGIAPFSRCSPSISPRSVTTPNPNPYRFRIVSVVEQNGYTLATVEYPDCTTFDGIKLLLFKGYVADTLLTSDYLDPHFLGNSKLVARFKPGADSYELICKITGDDKWLDSNS